MSRRAATAGAGPFLRYAAVIVAGLCVDVTIAFLLATVMGMPLSLAAGAGFVIAAGMNYVLLELWAFTDRASGLSFRRSGLYLLAALATLGVRLVVIWLLAPLADSGPATLLVLCAAIGASFFFNFAVSRYGIFARDADHQVKGGLE